MSDDGPGIDAAHLPRLFERFYRVDPGRSRQHGGAGLGLSIVKHLVESMDGSIDVTSELGKGTRFVVTLPRGYWMTRILYCSSAPFATSEPSGN